MVNSNIQKFNSKFCQWYGMNFPLGNLAKFKSSLRLALDEHIHASDEQIQIIIRDILDSKDLNLKYVGNELIVGPGNRSTALFVGTQMPSWDRGLRSLIRDEVNYDIISWFFHFSSQYVSRSRIVDVIGALSLVYDRKSDFRGHNIHKILLDNDENLKSNFINHFKQCAKITEFGKYNSREKLIVFLIEKINALDPFIQRIFFNFINSRKLFFAEFVEEAITSLDKTVDVVQQYARERMYIEGTDHRRLTLDAFKMNESEKFLLERLYDIRNFFGGHPSMSKWWDFYEIFEEDFEQFFDVTNKLIIRVVLHENNNRVVNKNPDKWSTWFVDNSMMLWNSVWFDKVQKNIR